MTKHTKEPWRILPGKYPNVPQPIFSEDGQIASVGGYHEPGHAQRVANARRIVACVNACAGIPTEVLEKLAEQPGYAPVRRVRWLLDLLTLSR